MIDAMLNRIPLGLLAQAVAPPREAYRRWSSLMLILTILAVIVLTGLAFLLVRRRARRRMEQLPRHAPLPHVNAWEEAGRRFAGPVVEPDDE